MPNLESPMLPANAPTVHMKTKQKTKAKAKANMIVAAKGSTTKNNTSSDQTKGVGRNSKQIFKRGKEKFQKVSMV